MEVGDTVEYQPLVGGVERGTVTRIIEGRVYVEISRTNTRGRKVERAGLTASTLLQLALHALARPRLRAEAPSVHGRTRIRIELGAADRAARRHRRTVVAGHLARDLGGASVAKAFAVEVAGCKPAIAARLGDARAERNRLGRDRRRIDGARRGTCGDEDEDEAFHCRTVDIFDHHHCDLGTIATRMRTEARTGLPSAVTFTSPAPRTRLARCSRSRCRRAA